MNAQPDSVPLRELLLSIVSHENRLVGMIIRREGLRFESLATLIDDQAALLGDERTIKWLEGRFELPVRRLDPNNSLFLGRQTFLAKREGRVFYHLKVPKSPLLQDC